MLLLALLLAPGAGMAATALQSASVTRAQDRTRIEIESSAQLRFSLLILRYPNRIVLELHDVNPGPVLADLADRLGIDHPHLHPPKISRSPEAGTTRMEFALKGELVPGISTLRPQSGHGYRVVLDIIEPSVAAARPAPPPAAPLPRESEAPAAQSSSVPAPAPAPAPAARMLDPSAAGPAPSAAVPSPPRPSPQPTRRDDSDLVLLELRLDEHVLADALTSYQFGRETFLPLGEVAKLLSLAIRTQPDRGTAEGFVLAETRRFSLNVGQARLALGDETLVLDPAQIRVHKDDIYVESGLLSRWLPVDFKIDLSSLTVRAQARERLPMQERLERERASAKLGPRTKREDPGYPRQDVPYRLLGVPFVDQTLGFSARGVGATRHTSSNYTAYLTGDLLGTEASLFVSRVRDPAAQDVRFTMARHDPDAGLLGPLGASSVMFGSGVAAPAVSNVASRSALGKGQGLMLSNRPLTQPINFDRHTLEGDLPPGWDVELYFNDALVGFQTSRPDGRYRFEDQPLTYGPNEFRLVFHGPLGQQRIERHSFPLDQSGTAPGAVQYNFVQHHDRDGQSRHQAQFDWGLSRQLTASAGLVRLPAGLPGGAGDSGSYGQVGLRAFLPSMIVSSDLLRSPNGGWLNETGLKTQWRGLGVSYSRIQLRGFSSEVFPTRNDSLRSRDKLRLDAAIPASFLPRVPMALEVLHDQHDSGRSNLALLGRVSLYAGRTSISNQVSWQSLEGTSSANGSLHLSRRVGQMGLHGELSYTASPTAKLQTLTLSADKRLGAGYLLNLGVSRSLANRHTVLAASFNKDLGSYGLGLSTSYASDGTWAAGLQLFIAMGKAPRNGQWRLDAVPGADGGRASARVFLDGNANGIMDPGEEPISNVAFTVNGSRAPGMSDEAGIAWLDRLPTRQHVDIAVDSQTLEDPYWAPARKGVRMLPRPGQAVELDFPVILTSEIDGTVSLRDGATKRPIGDVVIELLDLQRKLLSTTKTGPDGYYIVAPVTQGRYYVRVSPSQLRESGLNDPGMREITVLPDGKFVSGIDFLLLK